MGPWSIEYEGKTYERFYLSLPEYEQAVLTAAIDHVLKVQGVDICAGEWGTPLGNGLFEFRVRRSLDAIFTTAGCARGTDRTVLIRVFCTFYGDRVVLLLYHGYDKKRDPSEKRQQREIARARKLHEAWKRRSRH